MLRSTLMLLLLSITTAVCGEKIERSEYQQVIDKHYPGFRILDVTDFAGWLRKDLHDGIRGSLIVGRFNFDPHIDFAAIIVSTEAKLFDGHNNDSYDYFVGKEVVCYGQENARGFECKETGNLNIIKPYSNEYLERVTPSTYSCLEYDEKEDSSSWKDIKTEIDSIGTVFPEKASSFDVLNRDGSVFHCTTSD